MTYQMEKLRKEKYLEKIIKALVTGIFQPLGVKGSMQFIFYLRSSSANSNMLA